MAERRAHKGLYERVLEMASALRQLPDRLSDEEVEGVVALLPKDTAGAVSYLLRPSIREASTVFLKAILAFLEEASRARQEGKKIFITAFNFPPEIIHLFDSAVVLTTELLSTVGVMVLEGQGERYWDYAMGVGLPDHLCSASTIEVGSVLTGADFLPDALINSAPGSCDANAKVHEFVARYLDIPQFSLDKTNEDGGRGLAHYRREFRRLLEWLQELTGEELKDENLFRVAECCNRSTELYWDLWELKRQVPCPVPGVFSPFTYGARFAMWGRPEGAALLQACVDTSRRILEDGSYPFEEERARIFWTYVSHYFDAGGFFGWMEERGISYMGDLVLICFPKPIDLSSRETVLDGLAETAWDMFMTRQMGAEMMSARWMDDLIFVIKDLGVDSLAFCGHHSCKQTWSVFSQVRAEVQRRAGVPTLALEGDSWNRRTTPMEVLTRRIEEFVDNVVARRRRRASRSGPAT